MQQGNQNAMTVKKGLPKQLQNPIEQIQARYNHFNDAFKVWLAKQTIAVETAVVTTASAAQGAAIGAFMSTLSPDKPSAFPIPPPNANLNPQAMASLKQAQALSGGPLIQARNFAVMTGVNAGISCVLRRLRGKEDVQSRVWLDRTLNSKMVSVPPPNPLGVSMAAAFGSGVMFSLVSGMGGANAVTSGVFFAVVQGGLFQVGQKFSQPAAEDINYAKTRSMLNNLGLQNYEKNFKKGLLSDNTLPLLNDSALRDVKIPPGPRLLILDQIQREHDLREKHGSRR
ncbi:SAM domain family protein [Trifolium pratense]|uniref:SAM domain family protein n=2 Tax=Trifolium TaxID=3898 RepID=A0A2K3P349_TRIPR|nr:SAM domain family protein [Trifolium pratense]